MKSKLIFPAVLLFTAAACSGRDGARSAAQQQYETVQEGSAAGVTANIGGPGESLPPITGTDMDTTTALALNPNALPPGTPIPTSTYPPPMTSAAMPTQPAPRPITPVQQPTPPVPQQVEPTPAEPATDTTATTTAPTEEPAPPPPTEENSQPPAEEPPPPPPPGASALSSRA